MNVKHPSQDPGWDQGWDQEGTAPFSASTLQDGAFSRVSSGGADGAISAETSFETTPKTP